MSIQLTLSNEEEIITKCQAGIREILGSSYSHKQSCKPAPKVEGERKKQEQWKERAGVGARVLTLSTHSCPLLGQEGRSMSLGTESLRKISAAHPLEA